MKDLLSFVRRNRDVLKKSIQKQTGLDIEGELNQADIKGMLDQHQKDSSGKDETAGRNAKKGKEPEPLPV